MSDLTVTKYEWLLGLLKGIEEAVPPPRGNHHTISYNRYGNEEDGWEDKLGLHIIRRAPTWTTRTMFLEPADFSKSWDVLVEELVKLLADGDREAQVTKLKGEIMSQLVDNAKRAIDKIFEDTSVPHSTTGEHLRDLRDHIEMCLDALTEE